MRRIIGQAVRKIQLANFENAEAEQAVRHGGRVKGRHIVRAYDPIRKKLIWEAEAPNTTTNAGANYLVGAGFLGSPAPISSWFVGLIKDNRTVNDGAITSGAAILTSATVTFVSGDAGRQITVYGAGAAGANLVTTILTFTNSTTVTLADNAGTTVTGAITSLGPKFAVGDTMGSHAGWAEIAGADIQNVNRPAWTGANTGNGQVDDSASQAVYNMSASLVGNRYLHGLFLISDNTLGGTTGTLYSEAEFTAGAQTVQASYVVSDTYQIQVTPG